jgi:hypothetical protein
MDAESSLRGLWANEACALATEAVYQQLVAKVYSFVKGMQIRYWNQFISCCVA